MTVTASTGTSSQATRIARLYSGKRNESRGVWEDFSMAVRRFGWVAIVGLAVAFGLLTLSTARREPVGSLAGTSALGALAELGVGWSLVAAGALFALRHRGNRVGFLLAAAGFAWFLPEWTNPDAGSGLAFTLGLVGYVACVPLVAHAALAYPSGRLRSRLDVAVLTVSYSGALLLLGLLPATVFDPRPGCVECPRNLALVHGDTGLYETFNRYGLRIGIGWVAALGVLVLWRLVRSSRSAAVVTVPALVPVAVYLGLVAWDFEHSLGRGFLGNESFDRTLWRCEAAALAALAVAVGWGLLRERLARASVARLVVELGRMPRPGAVRDALAAELGDPGLDLVYRRPGSSRFVDASGRPVECAPGPGRAVTPLVRAGEPVAALLHDARLLEQPGLVQEVLAAARVAVENEQLQAEVRAQVEELRSSRTRIVETGDAERRRLERDLHDGAQQQLVALTYDLRLARVAAEVEGATGVTTLLAAADDEAQTALEELRELAHGIYPAILAEAGLAAALRTLADAAQIPVELGELPAERYDPPVETAAYLSVSQAIADGTARGATFIAVNVRREADRLLVEAEDDGAERRSKTPTVHVADRVGALGGSLAVGPQRFRAEMPCA
jgi:signal transduction histidine kinase